MQWTPNVYRSGGAERDWPISGSVEQSPLDVASQRERRARPVFPDVRRLPLQEPRTHCTALSPYLTLTSPYKHPEFSPPTLESLPLIYANTTARFELSNHHHHTNITNPDDQGPELSPHLFDVCRRPLGFSSKHACSSSSWQQPIRGQILSRHCQASSNQTARPPGGRRGHEVSFARAGSLMRRAGRLLI